jgi:hypothetical protein
MIEQQQNDSELIAEALGACADGFNACIDRIEELERRVSREAKQSREPKVQADEAEIPRYPRCSADAESFTQPIITPLRKRMPSREEIAELRREVHIARLREMAALTAVVSHRKRPRPVNTVVRQQARGIMAEAERRLREPRRPLSPAARAMPISPPAPSRGLRPLNSNA